jgi:hypothetical protein
MTVLVYNCRRTTCSSHSGLRHNNGRSALKRRHMFRNFELHLYEYNERQAGETTGN